MAEHGAVPITILTGFLGAGKTTLLNRILSGEHGLRVGVLVNDFGAINIDAQLVVGVEGNAISLANGCVCCQIRDDLVASVGALLERPEAVEYILLEASGIADPAGIFVTFNDPNLRDRIRLDGVICVVDAEQFFAHPEYPPLMDLKLRQVGFADMAILNKAELAGAERLDQVRAWLDERFNRLRIVETNFCDVPYEILLSAGHFDRWEAAPPAAQDHSRAFSTWSYETEKPIALDALREAVRKLPGSIYRIKGIIYTSDAARRCAVLHAVGRRVDIALQDGWGQRTPRTQIVAIGSPAGIDASALAEVFDACAETGTSAS